MKKIVILGPAHPLRGGGITTFNERLAKEFQHQGYETCIFSFSLLYPEFLFPGKSQFTNEPPPPDLKISSEISSINPFSWILTGKKLQRLAPDLIVVRFWLPFVAAALGTILRIAKKNKHTRVIAITDNITPHEKRPGDQALTRFFLASCDAFVTMSDTVTKDLERYHTGKPAIQVLHPLYDTFGEMISKQQARKTLNIDMNLQVMLFFGFIRKYKGLDILFDAMKILNNTSELSNVKLLVAGEYYEDEKIYQAQINQLGIRKNCILRTGYIPQEEVKNYFCAADVVIQPYRNATQSGVTPLAYHFEKPMIVTNVGSLAGYVPHEKAGLVAEPNAAALAAAIRHYFELGEQYFIPHLRNEKKKYSWTNLVKAIVELGMRYKL